jgi:hypothetical protein
VQPALVLSASKDESIRLWNVYTACCVAIFAGDQGHRDEVLSIDVHLLGNVFASCGMDNTVKVWSLEGTAHTGRRVARAVDQSFCYSTQVGGAAPAAAARADRRAAAAGPLAALLPGQSHDDGAGTGAAAASPRKRFQTLQEQFPLFSTSHVHSDYVDCVRWVGPTHTLKTRIVGGECRGGAPFPEKNRRCCASSGMQKKTMSLPFRSVRLVSMWACVLLHPRWGACCCPSPRRPRW